MKKFDQVINEVVNRIKNNNVKRINEMHEIINSVCEEYNFKGNEFSICYTLGIA